MVDVLLASRLAARLRRVRLERGLTLRQAAAQTGVTKETLSDLERARRQPHPPTLQKIAEGYGVEIRDLLGPIAEAEPVTAGKAEAPRGSGPADNLPETVAAGDDRYLAASAGLVHRLRERWEEHPPKKADLFHLDNILQSFVREGPLPTPPSGGTTNDDLHLGILISDLEKLIAIAERVGESEEAATRRRQALRLGGPREAEQRPFANIAIADDDASHRMLVSDDVVQEEELQKTAEGSGRLPGY